jgi:hypothetical protein
MARITIHLEELVQPRDRLGAQPHPGRRYRRVERRERRRFVGDPLKARDVSCGWPQLRPCRRRPSRREVGTFHNSPARHDSVQPEAFAKLIPEHRNLQAQRKTCRPLANPGWALKTKAGCSRWPAANQTNASAWLATGVGGGFSMCSKMKSNTGRARLGSSYRSIIRPKLSVIQ